MGRKSSVSVKRERISGGDATGSEVSSSAVPPDVAGYPSQVSTTGAGRRRRMPGRLPLDSPLRSTSTCGWRAAIAAAASCIRRTVSEGTGQDEGQGEVRRGCAARGRSQGVVPSSARRGRHRIGKPLEREPRGRVALHLGPPGAAPYGRLRPELAGQHLDAARVVRPEQPAHERPHGVPPQVGREVRHPQARVPGVNRPTGARREERR